MRRGEYPSLLILAPLLDASTLRSEKHRSGRKTPSPSMQNHPSAQASTCGQRPTRCPSRLCGWPRASAFCRGLVEVTSLWDEMQTVLLAQFQQSVATKRASNGQTVADTVANLAARGPCAINSPAYLVNHTAPLPQRPHALHSGITPSIVTLADGFPAP